MTANSILNYLKKILRCFPRGNQRGSVKNGVDRKLLFDTRKTLFDIVWERAAISSADYVQSKLSNAVLFPTREKLRHFALSKVNTRDLFVEFGVYKGKSINLFAKKLAAENIRIYGFDSFEGLKEDWSGHATMKGGFSLQGKLPDVLPNVTLIKGWFDETVPKFLAEHRESFSFIHMDADTYESNRLVLGLIKNRIAKDTIIVFDEYLGIPNWENGEFLAWQEFCKEHNVRYKYLGFSVQQAAIQVI